MSTDRILALWFFFSATAFVIGGFLTDGVIPGVVFFTAAAIVAFVGLCGWMSNR